MQHHEDVTIPETAKALTDMRVLYDNNLEAWNIVVDFQSEFHHTGPVDVLNTQISGATAAQKIDAIAEVAINHPESLANLPIIIISGLADDDLNTSEKNQIRQAWASMPSKNLLEFIQAYAISELFHSPDRVKYFTSIDRFLHLANKLTLNNTESLSDIYNIGALYSGARSFFSENVQAFRPLHNVFGGQTGIEASDTQAVFENNYNRFTASAYIQARAVCSDCDNGQALHKNWASVIPARNGEYRVDDVAEWLWDRFISDGGKNYTQLERAHLVSLIGSERDLNQLHCVMQRRIAEGIQPSQNDINEAYSPLELLERDNPWDPVTFRRCDSNLSTAELDLLNYSFSSTELESPEYAAIINEIGNRTLPLNSTDLDERDNANQDIGQGINFILSTPFIMAQEAR